MSGMAGFLEFMLPILSAALGVPLFEWLQKGISFLDNMNAAVKRIIVAIAVYWLNFAGVQLGVWTGMIDLEMMTSEHLTSLVSSGLAYLFHGQNRAKLAQPNVD